MNSYLYDIGEKERAGSRFIAHVRREVQGAFLHERKSRKLTQQQIATKLGINRSVVNRQLGGLENMTLRSVAELLWAMGWEPEFTTVKEPADPHANYKDHSEEADVTSQPASKPFSSTSKTADYDRPLRVIEAVG
jgi:transcriptional regulator with XRE-family HTH domain